MRKILVTGGAGYIGSHTVVELLQAGEEVVVYDNFCNSSAVVIDRIEQIAGRRPLLVQADLRDPAALQKLFEQHRFDAVVHFAGLKAVGESVLKPLAYYRNNIEGSLNLLHVMQQHDCYSIVFSSSATVYGDPASVPITEDFPLSATNPYGQTKLMTEQILKDLAAADARWEIAVLRYFNPVAAHPSGLIGEDPNDIPNNLMPYIAQVAVGRLAELTVFGDDYATPDGTGVRDYIHVVDLARAHLKALQSLTGAQGFNAYNIGTGQGYSVLQMLAAFEKACGRKIPHRISIRRPGDVAQCFADASLSQSRLGWCAEFDLAQMMADQWNWQSKNPNGYAGQ